MISAWRRELAVLVRAPILYVIGGLFLVVQGISFAGLVAQLSDPRRPALLGALLEGQLGGTLLTWVLQLVVLTLLGMRAIAEDRRTGAWELLLTAQVGEGAAVVGKWLAASTVYALAWLPTLAYLGVVAIFRADDGGWDLAAIAAGYLGAIALGAALLAWAIAASAATSSVLAAGALGFAWLVALLLVGELPSLWPDLGSAHPTVAAVLGAVSLRALVTGFARGEVTAAAVCFVAALAVVGLSLAIALACAGRRRRAEVRMRVGATLGLAAIGALATALATQHPLRWDVSAARASSLDPETRAVLGELSAPATLTIVEPTLGALAPFYDEVARTAERMADASDRLTVRRVDPASVPGGLASVARAGGLQPNDLAASGGVIVDASGRRRVVDLLALATIAPGPDGAPRIERLAVEQGLAGALAALSAARPITVCASTAHGELPLVADTATAADWRAVADRLRGEGMALEALSALAPSVPAACSVLVVAGPAQPLSPEDALAVQAFVQRGGGLLLAAASRAVDGALPRTGLEALLAAEGLGLPPAIAVDPSLAIRELPGALYVVAGYAAHPIDEGFANARPTIWYQPRAVTAAGRATVLVRATDASWGELDLAHAPARDADDLAGPVALAALGPLPHRVLALGSAESFASALLAGGASAGDLWLAQAIRYLANAPERQLAISARTPDQVRLRMTPDQRRAVIALCVAGIPLMWLAIGGAIVLVRRRKHAI